MPPRRKNGATAPFKKKVASSLKNIYAEAGKNGSSLIVRPLARSKLKVFFGLMFVAAFLASMAWLGLFLFGAGSKFSEENIDIKINGPEKAAAGEEVSYMIVVRNRQRIALANTSLELRYPENFEFISAEPKPTDIANRRWDAGALGANKEIKVDVKGRVWGAAGADLSWRVFFNYRPANFNADFQKTRTLVAKLEALPIELNWQGPEKISAGEEVEYKLTILNQGEKPLENLEISLHLPTAFKVSEFAPAPSQGRELWKLSSLAPTASSAIVFNGAFAVGDNSGLQTFSAVLNLRERGNVFEQQRSEKITVLEQSALSLNLAANGTVEKQSVNFGDKISFLLTWENTGQKSLKDVILRLVVDAPFDGGKSLINWPSLEDKADGDVKGEQLTPSKRRGTITWTKAQAPTLAEIKPQAKGSLEVVLSLRAKNDLNLAKLVETQIAAYAEAQIGKGQAVGALTLQSNNLLLPINSDLQAATQATFKEKKVLLPQVGQKYENENIYTVAWSLTNTLHELTDLKLSAALPESVDWKNITSLSAGEISYDAITKQVSWQLNRLPIAVGKVTIFFEVGVKYGAEDKDKIVTLIEKTGIEAKDKATGENLLFWKEPVKVGL